MSYTHLGDTTPKARKEYSCYLCGEKILVGEKHVARSSVFEGDVDTTRMHAECEFVSARWECWEWEEFEEGSMPRPKVKRVTKEDMKADVPFDGMKVSSVIFDDPLGPSGQPEPLRGCTTSELLPETRVSNEPMPDDAPVNLVEATLEIHCDPSGHVTLKNHTPLGCHEFQLTSKNARRRARVLNDMAAKAESLEPEPAIQPERFMSQLFAT